jgi:WD40 repeat protein
VARAQPLNVWNGHLDRLTAGDISADGRWFASGGRDRLVKLWDVKAGTELGSVSAGAEVSACLFLPDDESLVIADTRGRLTLYALPGLEKCAEAYAGAPVLSARRSPDGAQLALGCGDGLVRFVEVDGLGDATLTVLAARAFRPPTSLFSRLLGRGRPHPVYVCTCPSCHRSIELPADAGDPAQCPGCHRRLHVCTVTQ